MDKYECVEAFVSTDCDDDGFTLDTYTVIEQGTVWQEAIPFMIGGEIRLENDSRWLELPKEWVDKHFRKVIEDG